MSTRDNNIRNLNDRDSFYSQGLLVFLEITNAVKKLGNLGSLNVSLDSRKSNEFVFDLFGESFVWRYSVQKAEGLLRNVITAYKQTDFESGKMMPIQKLQFDRHGYFSDLHLKDGLEGKVCSEPLGLLAHLTNECKS
jgi:hypothetical protein